MPCFDENDNCVRQFTPTIDTQTIDMQNDDKERRRVEAEIVEHAAEENYPIFYNAISIRCDSMGAPRTLY